MIRARLQIAFAGLLVVGFLHAGCHRSAAKENARVKENPPVKENVRVSPPPVVRDTTGFGDVFTDTAGAPVLSSEGRRFDLRTPGQRDSLRALLRKELALWRARGPRDYRFLLRVGCFCPGPLGWVLMEVRNGQPVRARDKTGKAVRVADWNTFSIDGLFDDLERSVDRYGVVQIAFDARWHFPRYVYTAVLPGPDMWGTIEARALRPSAQR
jgi:hypothetical protein